MTLLYVRARAFARLYVRSSFLVFIQLQQINGKSMWLKTFDEPKSCSLSYGSIISTVLWKWWFIIYIDFLCETEYPLTFLPDFEQWPHHITNGNQSAMNGGESSEAIPNRKWNKKRQKKRRNVLTATTYPFQFLYFVVRISFLQSIERSLCHEKKAIIDWHQNVRASERRKKTESGKNGELNENENNKKHKSKWQKTIKFYPND